MVQVYEIPSFVYQCALVKRHTKISQNWSLCALPCLQELCLEIPFPLSANAFNKSNKLVEKFIDLL